MTIVPPLSFPVATGRLIADTSEMDWTQYTYWIEANGPLVVISEQQRLVAYVANDPAVLVDVPEPSMLQSMVVGFLVGIACIGAYELTCAINWRRKR